MPTKKFKEKIFSFNMVNETLKSLTIPGTDFVSMTTSEIHSTHNTFKNVVTGKILGYLSDKTGKSIADAKGLYDGTKNVFKCQYKEQKAILLAHEVDGKINYTVVSYKDSGTVTGVVTNNAQHYDIFLAMLVMRVMSNPEAKETFNRIEVSGGKIDKSQEEPFLKLSDNLVCVAKQMAHDSVVVAEGSTKSTIDELKAGIKDATAIDSYIGAETNLDTEACKKLGLDAASIDNLLAVKKAKNDKQTKRNEKVISGELRINKVPNPSWDETLKDGYEKAATELGSLGLLDNAELDTAYGMAKGWIKSLGLVGPAGTGKTKLASQIAAACGLPMVVVHGSENLLESDIVGSMELVNDGGVSVTEYKARPLLKAYEQGGLVFFDEVNTVSSGVLNVLNSILDGNGSFTFGDRVFHQHPDFRFICAWNNGYTGTNQLSPSFKDRLESKMMLARFSDEKIASIVEEKCGFKNFDIIKKMWSVEAKAEHYINTDGDPLAQVSSVRRIIAWVNRASMTGEFIRSACSTIMPDLCSDGAVTAYTVDAFMADQVDAFVPVIMQDIQYIFEDAEYANELDDEEA